MAVKVISQWFTQRGKGWPQVEQVNTDGSPKIDPETQKRAIGNEQYQANQLSADSIASEDFDSFGADVLEVSKGDLKFAAEAFREGVNYLWQREAGGLDPYQKAAKKILALDLPNFKGLSVDEVAAVLRAKENS